MYLKRMLAALLLLLSCLSIPDALAAEDPPYWIDVDIVNNITTVYSAKDNTPVRVMTCATGTRKWKTITGVYKIPKYRRKPNEREPWYHFTDGWGKYGTRIHGNFLFHSYLFHSRDMDDVDMETWWAMGTGASHGCVRLYVEDAKWIAENCFGGTKVYLHDDQTFDSYRKELLFRNTFITSENPMTYEQFFAMPASEDELGYGSRGDDVTELQKLLNGLGLLASEPDGSYGRLEVDSIRAIQKALGRSETGVADAALIRLLSSDEAPISTVSTLKKGTEGPAVTYLKQLLAAVGFGTGDTNESYDDQTAEAVAAWQGFRGQKPNGIADPALITDLIDVIGTLEEQYGSAGWSLVYDDLTYTIATVNCDMNVNVRRKASKKGSIVTSVKPGTEMTVLESGDEWTRVSGNGLEGYISTQYLSFREEIRKTPRLAEASAGYSTLHSPTPQRAILSARLASYAVVSSTDSIRIRETASSKGEMMFMLGKGSIVRVTGTDKKWTGISYAGLNGWTPSEGLEPVEVYELTGEYETESAPGKPENVPVAVPDAIPDAIPDAEPDILEPM